MTLHAPISPAQRFVTTATVDWSDETSVIDYLVDYACMLAGGARPFDETATHELVRREVERARNIAASENHGLAAEGEMPQEPLSNVAVPTLVIHGAEDPMFPLEHGEALAREISHAGLLTLQGAGHGVERADWETIAGAIHAHSAVGDRGRSVRLAQSYSGDKADVWRVYVEHADRVLAGDPETVFDAGRRREE